MHKVIIYTNDFDGVAMCVPSGEIPIEMVQAKDVPSGKQSFIVDYDSLPTNDMDFFNAWEQTNGVVTINLSKAKEATKERLREERVPLLLAQDVAFQRALETNADTTIIVAEKQRLRDLPNLTDSAQTLEQLRSLKASI